MRVGWVEILLIVAIILLLFGGKKIPELMRGLGQGTREFTPDQRLKIRPAAKDWEGRIAEIKKLLLEIIRDGSIKV